MQVKHRLIAEVIKLWRSDSEERALAEAILYMTGLHLTDLQKMSVQEVENVLIDVIRRPEEKANKEEIRKQQEQRSPTSTQEENEEKNLLEDETSSHDLGSGKPFQVKEMSALSLTEQTLQVQEPEKDIKYPVSKDELLKELNRRKGRKPKVTT